MPTEFPARVVVGFSGTASSGSPESFVALCAELTTDGKAITVGPPFPGTAVVSLLTSPGVPFAPAACPPNQIAAGFITRSDGTFLNAIGVQCAEPVLTFP